MHSCIYTDRLEIKNGKITRIVKADYKSKKKEYSMDVEKHDENNRYYCRNVFYNNYYHNYGIIFPGERFYGETIGLEFYGKCENIKLICSNVFSDDDKKLVESVYSDFNFYNLKYNSDVINAIYFWKKDKKLFDFLMTKNFKRIATTEKTYTLDKSRLDKLISFIDKTTFKDENKYLSLNTVFQINNLVNRLPDVPYTTLLDFKNKALEGNQYLAIMEKLNVFNKITDETKLNLIKNIIIKTKCSLSKVKQICKYVLEYEDPLL